MKTEGLLQERYLWLSDQVATAVTISILDPDNKRARERLPLLKKEATLLAEDMRGVLDRPLCAHGLPLGSDHPASLASDICEACLRV